MPPGGPFLHSRHVLVVATVGNAWESPMKDSGVTLQLNALIDPKRPVLLFCGAGISKPAGMPLWSESVETAIKWITPHTTPDLIPVLKYYQKEYDYAEVFELIRKKHAPPLYDQLLKSVFQKALKPGDHHITIARTGYSGIVTTNYDPLLEDAHAQINAASLVPRLNNERDLAFVASTQDFFLLKLHGVLQHVISREQELFSRGIASIREFVDELVQKYHIRNSAEDYKTSVAKGDRDAAKEAKAELQRQIDTALESYAKVRKVDLEALEKEKSKLERRVASERHKRTQLRRELEFERQRAKSKPAPSGRRAKPVSSKRKKKK
jgi:polyhydroxyalkanoate synthesis regulator phasin